ncbi:MAG: hypothetical protein WCH99_17755 [Verrucomicrobiota bacterium]
MLQTQRQAYEDSLAKLRHDQKAWNRTVNQIAAQVRKMPLWKLQTVGAQQLDFLYDKSSADSSITLKPGGASVSGSTRSRFDCAVA